MNRYESTGEMRATNVRAAGTVRRSGLLGVVGGLAVALGMGSFVALSVYSAAGPTPVEVVSGAVAALGYLFVALSVFGVHRRYGATYGSLGRTGAWFVGVGTALLPVGVVLLVFGRGGGMNLGPLFAFLWLLCAYVGLTALGLGLRRSDAPRYAVWAVVLAVPLAGVALASLGVLPQGDLPYDFAWSLAFGGWVGLVWAVLAATLVRDPVVPSRIEPVDDRRVATWADRVAAPVRRIAGVAGVVGGLVLAVGAVGVFTTTGALDLGRYVSPTLVLFAGTVLVALSAPAVYALGAHLGLEGTVGAVLAVVGAAGAAVVTGLILVSGDLAAVLLGVLTIPLAFLGLPLLGVALWLAGGSRTVAVLCALVLVAGLVPLPGLLGLVVVPTSVSGPVTGVSVGLAWAAACALAVVPRELPPAREPTGARSV